MLLEKSGSAAAPDEDGHGDVEENSNVLGKHSSGTHVDSFGQEFSLDIVFLGRPVYLSGNSAKSKPYCSSLKIQARTQKEEMRREKIHCDVFMSC